MLDGNVTLDGQPLPDGVQVGMADGSVRFVNDSITITVWRALGSINKGEIIGANF